MTPFDAYVKSQRVTLTDPDEIEKLVDYARNSLMEWSQQAGIPLLPRSIYDEFIRRFVDGESEYWAEVSFALWASDNQKPIDFVELDTGYYEDAWIEVRQFRD